jgi:hypothetical protein
MTQTVIQFTFTVAMPATDGRRGEIGGVRQWRKSARRFRHLGHSYAAIDWQPAFRKTPLPSGPG